MMKKILFLFLIVLHLLDAKVFIREYTYNASENDSKVSARKAALRQLQLLLIEEVGVTVRSRYMKNERLKNREFTKTIDAKYESFSQAITKSRILKENWDGEKFYLKVEMDIDPKGVAKAIDTINQPSQSEKEKCRLKEEAVKLSLKDLSSQDKIETIVSDAVKHPFSLPCNRWHFDIIYKFVHYDIFDKRYKKYLLDTLKTIELPGEDQRALYIIDYFRLDKGITKEEWKTVLPALERTNVSKLRAMVATAFSTYNEDTKGFVDQFLKRAKDGHIGLPKPLDYHKVVAMTVRILQRSQSTLFEEYYHRYDKVLTEKEDKELFTILKSRYFKDPTAQRLEMMIAYFKRQTPSKYISDNLFYLIKRLEHEGEKDPRLSKDFKTFVVKTEDVMRESFPLCPYPSGTKDRIEFMLRFNIDSKITPSAKMSAKFLFDDNYNKQLEYAGYLALMGKKARDVEKSVIKRLRRLERDRFNGATNMQWDLIDTLGNIRTESDAAIDLLINALDSRRNNVPDHAIEALTKLGEKAAKKIMRTFDKQEDSVKIRMIKVLGQLQSEDKTVTAFLRSVQTKSAWVKDALEDALEEKG